MTVAKIMSRKLITLSIDDDLGKAKAMFDTHRIHHIILTDERKLAGLISDRDIFKHLSPSIGTSKETPKDTALLQKKLHLIMSRKLVTAKEDLPLNQAAVLFHEHHISCLPIIDDNYCPIGIVTWRDILKVIALKYKAKLQKK